MTRLLFGVILEKEISIDFYRTYVHVGAQSAGTHEDPIGARRLGAFG
jgi:hypothetical protein